MPKVNKKLGIGTIINVPARFLHPKKLVQEIYGNELTIKREENLLVYKSGIKQIRGKPIFCVFLWHADFKNKEVYTAASLVKVDEY